MFNPGDIPMIRGIFIDTALQAGDSADGKLWKPLLWLEKHDLRFSGGELCSKAMNGFGPRQSSKHFPDDGKQQVGKTSLVRLKPPGRYGVPALAGQVSGGRAHQNRPDIVAAAAKAGTQRLGDFGTRIPETGQKIDAWFRSTLLQHSFGLQISQSQPRPGEESQNGYHIGI